MVALHRSLTTLMTSSIEPMSCSVVSRSRRVIVWFLTAAGDGNSRQNEVVGCQSEFSRLTSKVERDAERSPELVVPRVPLADRGVRVVDAGRDPEAPQLLRDLRDERLELGVGREGHDEALDRGDGRREGQDGAVDVVGAGPVRVLEERVEDAADTERGLDDVRDKLADCDTERQTPALVSGGASFSKQVRVITERGAYPAP